LKATIVGGDLAYAANVSMRTLSSILRVFVIV